MSDAGLLLLALALLAFRRRAMPVVAWGDGWSWPLPDVNGLAAVVTNEFSAAHAGVDIMNRGPVTWAGEPVLAARAGRVRSVERTRRGWSVVVDHGSSFSTFYQHLSSVNVAKGQSLTARAPIGTVGVDPLDPAQVRHLHFAVWFNGYGDDASVDPQPNMARWSRTKWSP